MNIYIYIGKLMTRRRWCCVFVQK